MQLKAENISFRYSGSSPQILKKVSLTVEEGERVAIVGPSGCGKSTLARILSGYLAPDEGKVLLDGRPLPSRGYCPVQLVHQHPELAADPRWKMEQILKEAWEPPKGLLDKMGIEPSWLTRWPSELSGGELQRFCIARVLSPETRFLICDEITTMLDVITQAQIWQLLREVSEKTGLSLLVITHNMALADKVCSRVVELPQLGEA